MPELDRVLGGGLVPASLVLVGGEPGVGKSTLLLAALGSIARGGRRALLVTGEESVAQVKLRAERLGGAEQVEILAETELESVCATLERERPDVCVIDSVQTLYSAELGSAPGSVAQVREAAGAAAARREGAGRGDDPRRPRDEGRRPSPGPRVLEHLVDCVLQFEGDRYHAHRILRAVEEPLRLDERARRLRDDERGSRRRSRPVRAVRPDARGRGRRRRRRARSRGRGRSCSRSRRSSRGPTSPCRVGSATGVDPKRLAMIVAVLSRHAGIALGSADVFVNVAGGVRIDEPGADLAVALAIASAASGRAGAGQASPCSARSA